MYPFDIQDCRMEFVLEDVDAMSIELFADPLWKFNKVVNGILKPNLKYYSGPRELDQYYIMDMQLKSQNIVREDENAENIV